MSLGFKMLISNVILEDSSILQCDIVMFDV